MGQYVGVQQAHTEHFYLWAAELHTLVGNRAACDQRVI